MWSAPEAPEYNQWALNPSAYQDLSHEEIDWALLAQQWIKMKETYPKDQVPPAPPPPPLGPRKDEALDERIENEGGEAPMDMETREESLGDEVPQWGSYNNWNNQWDTWNQWNSGGRIGPPPGMPPGAPPYNFGSDAQSVFSDGAVPGTIDYNHGNAEHFPQDEKVNQVGRPGIPNHGRLQSKHSDGIHHYPPGHPGHNAGPGYWPGSVPPGGPGDGALGQPHLGPYTKHNRNLWKHGVVRPPRDRFSREDKPKEEEEEEDTVQVIDAAKRRHLPAWIRDGLEKMEREKQKKLDRERQLKEREERLEQQRLEDEQEAAAIAAGAMPKKSKFESDSESESENKGSAPGESRKSRFHSVDSPGGSPVRSLKGRSPSVEKGPPKSREEIMQEVMMKVRQMLTIILLEVTNEEMRNIAEETHSKARMKAPATDLQKTPALASLTGKLGLGIYEDSDEESGTDSSEVDAATARQANGADSDDDLRETIRRRKQDFAKIEREIEADLAEEEEKERRLKGREDEEEDDEDDGDEPDEDGRNEEKSGRGTGSKNQAQVEHQKAGSNLHFKEHGLQEASGDADHVGRDGEPTNHTSASRGSRSPRDGSRHGTSTDDHESSSSRSSSSRVSGRRKSSKRSRDSRRKERKNKDKKRQRSSSREDDKKSKRRDSVESSRRGKSRSRSGSARRDRKHRDSSRESSRVGSRHDRLGHRDSYRDRGRDRDRYRDYRDRDRDRDRDSRRRRGGSRSRRSSSRGRSGSRSRRSRSRRSDSRSRRSSSRTRSHRRSRSRSRRSRSVDSRRRRDSSGSRPVSPNKNRRRRSRSRSRSRTRSRSRSRSRSHHKTSRRRHSSESSSERSSGKKSRHRRRD